MVLESKDLVNWDFCSYAFDRLEIDDPHFRLEDGKEAYGQGIWAPCIRYFISKASFTDFLSISVEGST